ncbi:lytic transglycosylase domain-containing protein [Lysobacter sp. TY2-98]|uniref:lytic transglycosylase domain-containing protein n=1 Tax=Lysobacter sp. TY2-98 TaxID=2290922 RepID=UPI000E1FD77C|nr:lytic transglycosylase domain-containing protein [Lysobacter sp. TY2-98]AXK71463.1 lytic transglycosylase domain-containing protein [Lysobacter sp. TY2-98]
MKTPVALLLVAGLFGAAAPAMAGTVYRCDVGGVRSYSSKRLSGANCEVVSRYTAKKAPRYVAPKMPAQGAVTPVNLVAGSPATGSLPAVSTAAVEIAPAASAPVSSAPPTRLVQGQIYSYMQDGVRHYSSRRPVGVASAGAVRTIKYSFMETCYACGAQPGVNFSTIRLKTDAYRNEIAAAAAQYGVEESVVRAIIHAESAYNPNALSRVGAQGLMQLMPATARRFGVGNAFDPAQNIRGGVQYLAFLLKRFNGDIRLMAAGYNAGEGAVDKYGGVPPYSETQRYVQRVALLADRYRSSPVLR